MTIRQLHWNRVHRESSAIVFEGPVNTKQQNDGVIRFPDDDDGIEKNKENSEEIIDLSGSFTIKPSNNQQSSGTFANCGGFSQNGTFTAVSSDSGVFTYPNGTQVVYSKCQVVQTIGSAG
jgi:hypothetical protein